jgi:2-keto-4-pentenoate hydratase/2-oxohepta-3-ene-1,7-dioic acid hydratase in catechol pathway
MTRSWNGGNNSMRLASIGQESDARLCLLLGDGYIDFGEAATTLGAARLARFGDVGDLYRAGDAAVAEAQRIAKEAPSLGRPTVPVDGAVFGPPIRHPASIMCIGRNYREHIKEGNAPTPEYPILFAKFPNTLVGSGAGVLAHRELTSQFDYEGELAVVIGRRASRVPAAEALGVVAGYTVLSDFSGRDLQYQDVQWIRGKSLDTWCPLGPAFVSSDEIPDPHALRIQTRVNGELRQDASTNDMLFKIPELIEFITRGITLEPGDIIATGTPSGVGLGFNPPRWLSPGDTVDVTIQPIGTLHSVIIE